MVQDKQLSMEIGGVGLFQTATGEYLPLIMSQLLHN